MTEFRVEINNLEDCLEKYIPKEELKEVKRILYGRSDDRLELPEETRKLAEKINLELKGYSIPAASEELRKPRIVRIGAIQNAIVLPTTDPFEKQRNAIHNKVSEIIKIASTANVNIVCMQECWPIPFGLCTMKKDPWCKFAEDAKTGPTTTLLKKLAKDYNMVIVSPIFEKDNDSYWNTVVVNSNRGNYIGKHRKNHIPRLDDCNELVYYPEGNTGHPVFETDFGRIAINICYGRHHPQNWMMFGLNGAEIVFNPCAVDSEASEPLWGIEARNAAVANSYFTVAVNRVGTEVYDHEFKSTDGTIHHNFGPLFGSSYVAAPNGHRTPGLSRNTDGLLITEVDLNLCRQVKDFWGFRMTQRLDVYAESIARASKADFKLQIIRENCQDQV
ncbi:UPB1 family protein [Megaselia abdita]